MPEISRFFGITIRMHADEPNLPHFHIEYSGQKATFSIETGQMIQGDIPTKKAALITAWAIIHREELFKNWEDLQKGLPHTSIAPLR